MRLYTLASSVTFICAFLVTKKYQSGHNGPHSKSGGLRFTQKATNPHEIRACWQPILSEIQAHANSLLTLFKLAFFRFCGMKDREVYTLSALIRHVLRAFFALETVPENCRSRYKSPPPRQPYERTAEEGGGKTCRGIRWKSVASIRRRCRC